MVWAKTKVKTYSEVRDESPEKMLLGRVVRRFPRRLLRTQHRAHAMKRHIQFLKTRETGEQLRGKFGEIVPSKGPRSQQVTTSSRINNNPTVETGKRGPLQPGEETKSPLSASTELQNTQKKSREIAHTQKKREVAYNCWSCDSCRNTVDVSSVMALLRRNLKLILTGFLT